MTGKVFGIGLSRTGTTSLSRALTQLGYRTAHYVELRAVHFAKETWLAGNFDVDCLANYDAAVDLPVPVFYPQLDERYPGSKYILTVRDAVSWLASVRRHWTRYLPGDDPKGSYRRTVRLAMYGIHGFAEARMKFVYDTHVRNVHWFFRDRPGDLLVLDICAGDGWSKLCPFLARPLPPEAGSAFPWLNQG